MDYTSLRFAQLWILGVGIVWMVVAFAIPPRYSHHGATVFVRRAFPIALVAGLYPFAHQLFLKGLP